MNMRKTKSLRLLDLIAVLVLVVTACAPTAEEPAVEEPAVEAPAGEEAPPEEPPAEEPPAEEPVIGDGVLTIGTLLPITGDLAFLGPPMVAGARLAIEDINAAGGVFGADIAFHEGDSGDTMVDIANPEVDRLIALDVDAIIGAASSAVSKMVIDKITGHPLIMFSPSNTSPDFTVHPDDGMYFRTAPSDLLQGKVLADQVIAQGNETVAVLFRQEAWGAGLAGAFKENFEAAGGTVDPFLPYAVGVETFDAEIEAIVTAAPDAVVVIGFVESASILVTMHERGVGPTSEKNVWGVDGNIAGIGDQVPDPSILVGMRGTSPSRDLDEIVHFTDRLDGAFEGGVGGVFSFAAETYDAIIIVALAAAIAGTNDPVTVAAEINDVTRGGTKCTTFAECMELVNAGEDIDYDGVGGPYEFVDAGEPAAASFLVSTYDGGTIPNPDLNELIDAS